jgi:hypothetical protein
MTLHGVIDPQGRREPRASSPATPASLRLCYVLSSRPCWSAPAKLLPPIIGGKKLSPTPAAIPVPAGARPHALLSCSGRGACVKRASVFVALTLRGRVYELPVFDLLAGQTLAHSDEMAYFCHTVPMEGAVPAMLRMAVPVNCFKHGVWMGLRTSIGDIRRIEYAW